MGKIAKAGRTPKSAAQSRDADAAAGEEVSCFQRHTVAGEFAPFLNQTMPRDFGPCSITLNANAPPLFVNPGRYFTDLQHAQPAIVECLIVPFHLNDNPVGTLWAIKHTAGQPFDPEDARLLAGAVDTRFALFAPNASGCGGAGGYRVQADKSEDIEAILKNFPFWFAPDFAAFVGHTDRLPFDQHTLKALVAPRALLTTEGTGDLWTNPAGTLQTYVAAREVYAFLGVPDRIGIHYRPGGHEHNSQDWNALLAFADRQFFHKATARKFDQQAFPGLPRVFSWQRPDAPEPIPPRTRE